MEHKGYQLRFARSGFPPTVVAQLRGDSIVVDLSYDFIHRIAEMEDFTLKEQRLRTLMEAVLANEGTLYEDDLNKLGWNEA